MAKSEDYYKRVLLKTNETPRSELRGVSKKDTSNNNAASSRVFTQRENKFFG